MAQFQILAYDSTAKVQVAVLHADVVAAVRLILNGERGCLALTEHIQLCSKNLNVARRHLWILRLALADSTLYLNAPLTA